eukprot:GGOE01027073.1.p1 GENE.GGOE01027073.1~~GGOE01027073.1.p1  ORF type:complete len:253 (-),score=2.77 GGOE01027073.1:58-816(-)
MRSRTLLCTPCGPTPFSALHRSARALPQSGATPPSPSPRPNQPIAAFLPAFPHSIASPVASHPVPLGRRSEWVEEMSTFLYSPPQLPSLAHLCSTAVGLDSKLWVAHCVLGPWPRGCLFWSFADCEQLQPNGPSRGPCSSARPCSARISAATCWTEDDPCRRTPAHTHTQHNTDTARTDAHISKQLGVGECFPAVALPCQSVVPAAIPIIGLRAPPHCSLRTSLQSRCEVPLRMGREAAATAGAGWNAQAQR